LYLLTYDSIRLIELVKKIGSLTDYLLKPLILMPYCWRWHQIRLKPVVACASSI